MDQRDPWSVFEGRAGSELHILDAGTGQVQSKVKLQAPPVWDGLAAASRRLYVTRQDGSVKRLAGR